MFYKSFRTKVWLEWNENQKNQELLFRLIHWNSWAMNTLDKAVEAQVHVKAARDQKIYLLLEMASEADQTASK